MRERETATLGRSAASRSLPLDREVLRLITIHLAQMAAVSSDRPELCGEVQQLLAELLNAAAAAAWILRQTRRQDLGQLQKPGDGVVDVFGDNAWRGVVD